MISWYYAPSHCILVYHLQHIFGRISNFYDNIFPYITLAAKSIQITRKVAQNVGVIYKPIIMLYIEHCLDGPRWPQAKTY